MEDNNQVPNPKYFATREEYLDEVRRRIDILQQELLELKNNPEQENMSVREVCELALTKLQEIHKNWALLPDLIESEVPVDLLVQQHILS